MTDPRFLPQGPEPKFYQQTFPFKGSFPNTVQRQDTWKRVTLFIYIKLKYQAAYILRQMKMINDRCHYFIVV